MLASMCQWLQAAEAHTSNVFPGALARLVVSKLQAAVNSVAEESHRKMSVLVNMLVSFLYASERHLTGIFLVGHGLVLPLTLPVEGPLLRIFT